MSAISKKISGTVCTLMLFCAVGAIAAEVQAQAQKPAEDSAPATAVAVAAPATPAPATPAPAQPENATCGAVPMTAAMPMTVVAADDAACPMMPPAMVRRHELMMRHFERMMAHFADEWADFPVDRMPMPKMAMAPVQVADNKDDYTLTFALPGVEGKDLSVTVDGKVLTVKVAANASSDEKNAEGEVKTSSFSAFVRSIVLPDNVAADKIEAAYKNGVLTVKLPKIEVKKAPATVIPVKQ